MRYIDTVICPNCGVERQVEVEKIPTIYQKEYCPVCKKPFEVNVTIKFQAKKWPFQEV